MRKQFNNWFGAAFSKTDPALARKVLKYMHVDSWECGSQNWSSNFAAEFHKRRGYSLMPYLPLLAGIPMESASRSEDVLRDVRTTISDWWSMYSIKRWLPVHNRTAVSSRPNVWRLPW
ncbi:glycoside hydrolase [Bacteroides graminisolvens DSM 19988 = JCM 15093]|uniref:Glycoside hydrolase n=1 Tax=Bacteroides graminisolvens DSM 19988 = JCM 15093 TaxID=1121097 RepID=A0A069CZS0_9BACE|nr:glycoside hydrolase [Bacteroides graminisolvens DSM 19988 = JCM 15093]